MADWIRIDEIICQFDGFPDERSETEIILSKIKKGGEGE